MTVALGALEPPPPEPPLDPDGTVAGGAVTGVGAGVTPGAAAAEVDGAVLGVTGRGPVDT